MEMTISSVQLYELLAEQLGKEKAKNLVAFVEAKVEEGLHEKTSLFATKEDIGNIRLQIEITVVNDESVAFDGEHCGLLFADGEERARVVHQPIADFVAVGLSQ